MHRWQESAAASVTLLAACAAAAGRSGDEDRGAAAHARLVARIERFDADERRLRGFHPIATEATRQRRRELAGASLAALAAVDEAGLPRDGRVDLRLFRARLEEIATRLDWEEEDARAAAPLVPFLESCTRIERIDRHGEPWVADELAQWLGAAAVQVRELREKPGPEAAAALQAPLAVRAAAARARECRAFLDGWRKSNAAADPELGFWIAAPAERAVTALGEFAGWLEGTVLEELKKSPEGSPFAIGRDRYAAELRFERIDLTPERMLAFGEEQLAALQAEMTRETAALVAADGAAIDSGLADRPVDWRLGLELAKRDTVPIGGQRLFVQAVAEEAIRFCRDEALFPVPAIADECWRLRLSDLETQGRLAYGFYGRDFMGVSAPLPEMDHERKLECLRSNARPFTRTVVPHELIPGHHLQSFFGLRRARLGLAGSPFFVEGWAVHGEMTLDERGFFRGPRERVGHLFWRLLRAARIVVSTRYHLRLMTQAQMVDAMVEHAGLERSAAQAEVDRYMTYSPLYQCAYLHGATEIRRLREECRAAWGGDFSELRFNTELVEQGSIPIARAREALLGPR